VGANGEQTGYTYLINATTFNNEKTNLKNHIANRKTLISSFVP
jgi:hypothetical protein